MEDRAPELTTGQTTPHLLSLHHEPDWITHAADKLGYRWARIAWQRSSAVPGAWFDAAKADAVIRLWPKYFHFTVDRFAGLPFRLAPWQEVIVRLMVGWKAPIEILDPGTGEKTFVFARLYRQLRIWIPRKNGKSEFLAALALLFWALEGVPRGTGFVFARDEEQARETFDKMSDMVLASPSLKRDVRVMGKHLWIQKRKSAFRLLTGKPQGKHGRGPQVILGDEMHEWSSRLLMNTLRQGTGTKLQPVELYASTSGLKTAEVGYGLYQESERILDGTIDDPTTLVVIFALDEDDDWADEANWPKANPSLGLSPTLTFLRREAAIAKGNPRAEAEFRCFHMNQWIDAVLRWLPKKKWQACCSDSDGWRSFEEELIGRKCFLAFDASATQDVTAKIGLFPPEQPDEKIKLLCKFWIPEARVEKGSDYERWVEAGALIPTPGDAVDQDFVREDIKRDLELFDVQQLGRDPWNSLKLVTDLQKDGVDPELIVDMRQGHATLGEPTKEFERLVFAGDLDHGGHPVLAWMAGNAHIRFDENLNFVPAKKSSPGKIDGIVASVMALGLYIGIDPPEGPSVYEERGLMEIEV